MAAVLTLLASAARAEVPVPAPVAEVGPERLVVVTPAGKGLLPLFASRDWAHPPADIDRVVIIVHGYQRNAADYERIGEGLGASAGTMVVAPQFLAADDIGPRHVAGDVLNWQREVWASGLPANGPAPLSSFDAIDALLARLGDRATFPKLSQIVLAGFSAGGQFVQRYAIVGKGEDAVGRAGISLRYVVGSPSSFAYFGGARPEDGRIVPFAGAPNCPQYNNWRYGFAGNLPPYAVAAVAPGVPALEARYAARDVVYLAGEDDNNPHHRFLDTSCGAEAQGPERLSRTRNYFELMRQRDAAILRHRMWTVPGAAHNAAKVFGSACGRRALFDDKETCP